MDMYHFNRRLCLSILMCSIEIDYVNRDLLLQSILVISIASSRLRYVNRTIIWELWSKEGSFGDVSCGDFRPKPSNAWVALLVRFMYCLSCQGAP